MQIVINWDSGTEYLEINLDNLDGAAIAALTETREWWPDWGRFVYWNVTCELMQVGDNQQIIVTYTYDEQTDENILLRLQKEGHESWCGQNSIILEPDLRNDGIRTGGRFVWNPEDENEDESQSSWRVIGRPRNRIVRNYLERDSKFRANVLNLDNACVISGETTNEVLDAAHICPVADYNDDHVGNGIMLRTDIHRLYDRGMFIINPNNGEIELGSIHRGLSEEYIELLVGAQLPDATFNRVQEALQTKWTNPHP